MYANLHPIRAQIVEVGVGYGNREPEVVVEMMVVAVVVVVGGGVVVVVVVRVVGPHCGGGSNR